MWNPVIGLEIHVQLNTKSKIFSSASTNFGAKQNTQACAIDLGLPGVLPVLNEQAVLMAIKFGLAIGGKISDNSIFARKNYFYPDLPKGYQISQYEIPIVLGGSVNIKFENNNIILDNKRAIAMVNYYFKSNNSDIIKAEYTFGYKLVNGKLKIDLHHSSLPYSSDS